MRSSTPHGSWWAKHPLSRRSLGSAPLQSWAHCNHPPATRYTSSGKYRVTAADGPRNCALAELHLDYYGNCRKQCPGWVWPATSDGTKGWGLFSWRGNHNNSQFANYLGKLFYLNCGHKVDWNYLINHSVCPPRTAAFINRIVLQDDNHNHPSAVATTTTTSVGICNNLTTAFTVNLCLIIVVYRLGGGLLMTVPLVSMLMWIAVELQ